MLALVGHCGRDSHSWLSAPAASAHLLAHDHGRAVALVHERELTRGAAGTSRKGARVAVEGGRQTGFPVAAADHVPQ